MSTWIKRLKKSINFVHYTKSHKWFAWAEHLRQKGKWTCVKAAGGYTRCTTCNQACLLIGVPRPIGRANWKKHFEKPNESSRTQSAPHIGVRADSYRNGEEHGVKLPRLLN